MTRRRPIVLGIVGDSAAGKSTITRGLVELLGEDRVTHICADDYHKYDRVERARLGITPLHPDCNYLHSGTSPRTRPLRRSHAQAGL